MSNNIRKSINLLVTEGTIEPYTFILATANHTKLGQIICVDDNSIKVELHSNSADKITFTTYKYYQDDHGNLVEQPLWEQIEPLKYMYCLELDEYFIINVDLNDEHSEQKISKDITATSQCEIELSNKKIYDFEVNTEKDYMIADTKNMYYTTYFYRSENTQLSLLHRILTFAPGYSIGTIDDSLLKAFATDIRSFSVSNSTVYDFLTNEVANEFHCIFEFNTVSRIINIHDLYSTCKSCGYYGEFTAQCPKCGGIEVESYGTDTTVFVSTRNLTDQVQFSTDTDSIKNCFRLSAGDDLMNVAIREINPTGSECIYHITNDTRKDFSDSLKQKLSAYDSLYATTVATAPIGIDTVKIATYNNIVSKYKQHYDKYYQNSFKETTKTINQINSSNKGTDIISQYYAESLEFQNFLQYAMLPSVITSDVTSSTEKTRLESAINDGKFNSVGIPSSTPSQMILENAVKNYVKLYVRSGYMKIEIVTTAFSTQNLTWSGHIVITNYSDETDVSKSKDFNVVFTKDVATYITQKAQKDIADAYKKDNTYFDVFSIDDDNRFVTALKLYNSTSLVNIFNAYQSALTVLATSDNAGLNTIKSKYQNRLNLITQESVIRESECNIVSNIYSLLSDRLISIHNTLSIENYLGEKLYTELSLYVREDEYSNNNYISDSLTSPMVASHAKKFLETATKELIKASTPQHTISTSIKNLALIPEFKPYILDFSLDNWIRVECDGFVYRLRLISFSIDFGKLSDISVEFSDVTIAPGFISDMQSLINQATSMAGTYDYTTRQAEKGYESNGTINTWIKDGLNSANVVIKSNDNEEVTFDRSGLWAKTYDDVTEDYDNKQLRITHNILAFTKDNWKSVEAALGEHNYIYWNGSKFISTTDYGLTAQFITAGHISGGQIIGSELLSDNWNGSNQGTYIDLRNNVVKLSDKLVFENNKLTFGSDVTIKWEQIEDHGEKWTTEIGNNWIKTANVTAKNLVVKSAHIDGTISCDKLRGGTINGQTINGGTINGTTINGTTINGGTINGAYGNFTNGFSVNVGTPNYYTTLFKIDETNKHSTLFCKRKEGMEAGIIIAADTTSDNVNLSLYANNSLNIYTHNGERYINLLNNDINMGASSIRLNGFVTLNGDRIVTSGSSSMNFNWSGKDGQPTWLWGGDDGSNMYVYNPSNFSVDYANSAGSASSLVGTNSYTIQSLELSFTTPYIDFHYNNSSDDYTTRLIEDVLGRLTCYGNFKATGELRSKGSYDTTTTAAPNAHIANGNYDHSIYRSTSSSKRYKFDIKDANLSEIKKLYSLPIRTYKYNLDYLSDFDERYNKDIYGFIAEELDKIMPIAVNHNEDGSAEMWNNNIIVPCLLGLIQDLNQRLVILEKEKTNNGKTN